MRQIAPTAQDRAHGHIGGPSGELVGDGIEIRTAACRHDYAVGFEDRRQPQHRGADVGQIRTDDGHGIGGHVMSERRLVAGYADQSQPRGGDDRAGHLVDGVRLAATRAAARHADLDAHVHWPDRACFGQRRRHQFDSAHRVDPAHQGEVRMRVEFGGQPAQCGRVDQLIGQYDIADTERSEDADLADGGGCDSARTRVELASQQLRGHMRLAVWRELDAPLVAPLRHRGEVCSERVREQYAHRADGATSQQAG